MEFTTLAKMRTKIEITIYRRSKVMADKLKSCAEYFVKVKYIDYVKESIENGDAVETIVLHILDKEGTTYAESWEMTDHMDDFILAIASEM